MVKNGLSLVCSLLTLFFCAALFAQEASNEPISVVEGFDVPECVLPDPESDFVYVSNIEADGEAYWEDNGKGFISRLNVDGTVETLRWIDSSPEFVINSPKGMCILNNRLYVADNTRILVFALPDGDPIDRIEVPGAEGLNDMATDGQGVYVSDFSVGHILRLDVTGEESHEIVAALESVNGITFHNVLMFAVSWDLHEVYEVVRSGEEPPQAFGLEAHFVNLDGIEVLDDGSFIVSDFPGNRVVQITSDRKTVTTFAALESPADIGIDRGRALLYVPQFLANRVAVFELP